MDDVNNNSSANSGLDENELNAMIANLQKESGAPVSAAPSATPAPVSPISSAPQANPVAPSPVVTNPTPAAPAVDLDNIKGEALSELRPLVDKLNLAPADKFNVLLLMIRSSDDSSLVPEAHEVAKTIPDEARKAQALLDIIKEIDFFDQSK